MSKFDDLSGKVFGWYTVVKRTYTEDTHNTHFLCRCKCGNERPVSRPNLLSGRATSCGCRPQRKAPKVGFNRVLDSYKRGASGRKISFKLTNDQFSMLIKGDCHYCGIGPSKAVRKTQVKFLYNGIDRKDPKIGYVRNNCVSCCEQCNKAKMSMGYTEFIEWVNRVSSHLNS